MHSRHTAAHAPRLEVATVAHVVAAAPAALGAAWRTVRVARAHAAVLLAGVLRAQQVHALVAILEHVAPAGLAPALLTHERGHPMVVFTAAALDAVAQLGEAWRAQLRRAVAAKALAHWLLEGLG